MKIVVWALLVGLGICAVPFILLFVIGLLILLFPVFVFVWGLVMVLSIFLWHPKDPGDEDIKQVV